MLIMEKLKISSAHAGENISLAAAIACEKLLEKNKICWPSWKNQTNKIIFNLLLQYFSILSLYYLGAAFNTR